MVASGAAARIAATVARSAPAPPSARSSRSTEVMTTCFSPILRHRLGDALRARWGRAGRAVPVATLQKAQARVQVSPMIIMVAWPWRPALADVRAGRLLADGDQAVGLHDPPGRAVAGRAGRADPQPRWLGRMGVSARACFSGWRAARAKALSITVAIGRRSSLHRSGSSIGVARSRFASGWWPRKLLCKRLGRR